jgi:hypothetical protein
MRRKLQMRSVTFVHDVLHLAMSNQHLCSRCSACLAVAQEAHSGEGAAGSAWDGADYYVEVRTAAEYCVCLFAAVLLASALGVVMSVASMCVQRLHRLPDGRAAFAMCLRVSRVAAQEA